LWVHGSTNLIRILKRHVFKNTEVNDQTRYTDIKLNYIKF